jgi:hypothetical protein
LLSLLAEVLNLSIDKLLGLSGTRQTAIRGQTSQLEQLIEIISQLPGTKQKLVSEILDNVMDKRSNSR